MARSHSSSSPELWAHQQWLGFVQPVGLVVSLPALEKALAYVNRNVSSEQQTLLGLAPPTRLPGSHEETPCVRDFPALCRDLLGWQDGDLVAPPDSLEVVLVDQGVHLRPSFAVPAAEGDGTFQALVMTLLPGTDLDARRKDTGAASPQEHLERLLHENNIAIGLLFNGVALRLVHAPRCEAVGHVTFPVAAMSEPAGRPILAALLMLLGADRMFNLPPAQRLPAILRDSRRYQNEVSTRLADQVLGALHELLRGFQAADQVARGQVLGPVLRSDPGQIYGGLLSTLLRLVFLLYAEDWDLVSSDAVYVRHYSVTGLFEQLRQDASRFVDTMDQRFGAWSRLLSLFRLVFAGGKHGKLSLPPRLGELFDPDAFPFLEGRAGRSGTWQPGERLAVPRVSDGSLFRVLEKLLVLDGDRLSYRALEVEQIGSVYEAIMGFTVEQTAEPAVALRPHHVVVGLDALLKKSGADRLKFLADEARCKVTGKAQDAVKSAKSADALVAALGKSLSPRTPEALPVGTLVLQPTEERRRSGSHYTPRLLTEPIVDRTLRPVLAALGESPTPAQILGLRVCDPAMGSGAFLVAACDHLARRLEESWQRHGLPADVAKTLRESRQVSTQLARRLVAQCCLYGVDKNPLAVNLAKLSLWLFTLSKDQPFTFLDHALRHGDSLVGLSREQIASFHWAPEKQVPLLRKQLDDALTEATALRHQIHTLAATPDNQHKSTLLTQADEAVAHVRHAAHLVVEAYLAHDKDKDRKDTRKRWESLVASGAKLPEIPTANAVAAFHWELEFPEVFARENGGFDAFVGNPPFLGGKRISTNYGDGFASWLAILHEEAGGNTDLAGHFFRRTFYLLRQGGTFGLIATNTIAQGDTRSGGLRWICQHQGTIYEASRRKRWPGLAAVVVSIVHVVRGEYYFPLMLDGHEVEGEMVKGQLRKPQITAYLFDKGSSEDPARLLDNQAKSFIGCDLKGQGFLFDDLDPVHCSPLSLKDQLYGNGKTHNAQRIFEYLGGEEVNSSPTHSHHRYAINFGQMALTQAQNWPDLLFILEQKVKQERAKKSKELVRYPWWQYWRPRAALYSAIHSLKLERVLVNSQVSAHLAFAFQPVNRVFAHTLDVFLIDNQAGFCCLQSRIHEVWARFFGSSMKDDLRYTPSDCFETFPFPPSWQTNPGLEAIGQAYYDHRAALMADKAERAKLMDGMVDPEIWTG